MTRKEFIEKLAPYAIEDYKRTGILASLTLAQGCIESANGNSGLTLSANNLFGIKADNSWKGAYVTMRTAEYRTNGEKYYIDARFRKYDTWYGSVADHSLFLLRYARYNKTCSAKDYKTACYEIGKSGYATDPNYGKLLLDIIERYELYKYDQIENEVDEMEELKNKPVSAYAENAWKWAKEKGFIDGTMPGMYVTREQLAVILQRVYKDMGKI